MTKKIISYNILKIPLLVIFAVIAIWYSIIIPAGEGVDETPHFDYVRYVKEHQALPVQPHTLEEGVQVWMGHHPPLYYLLGSLLIFGVDTSDFALAFRPNPHFIWAENNGSNGWNVMLHFGQDHFPWKGSVLALHLLRLMTVGMGIVALYAMYRAAQLLFPDQPLAPLGAVALIGLNPSFIFMSSTVHHDTLQTMIFSLAAWWALRFLREPERKYDAWLGGILAGAALLTKLSGLALVPVLYLALFLRAWQQRNWWGLPRQAAQLTIAMISIAGWWFVRNQWLYGDPLGWQMFLNIHRHMARTGPYTWDVFIHEFLGQIGRTFWGAFGYMHITFPEIAKYFWWLSGLAGLGLILGLLRSRSTVRAYWPKWTVVMAIFFLLFASFVRFSMATVGAGHGRYLFPAGFSIGALFITGLNGFFNWRYQRFISVVVTIGMLIYAIYLPLNFVLPKYAPPTEASKEEMLQMEVLNIRLVEGVELVGYYVADSRVFPGQWVPISLYWKATGDPADRQDPLIRLEMVDEGGNTISSSDNLWPVPSMPPQVWQTNTIYVTRFVLGLPPKGLPGELHLTVTSLLEVSQSARKERVYLGKLLTTGGTDEVKLEDVPLNRKETFAAALRLLGYRVSSDVIRPGDSFTVSLFWKVLEHSTADYTVFIHLLDAKGELITQFDRPAGGTTTPTSTWQVGQVLRDTYPLSIPRDTPAGSYVIRMGMYLWPSMERLPVSIEGEVMENDFVDLGTIQIGH